jgi:hypothetical protein
LEAVDLTNGRYGLARESEYELIWWGALCVYGRVSGVRVFTTVRVYTTVRKIYTTWMYTWTIPWHVHVYQHNAPCTSPLACDQARVPVGYTAHVHHWYAFLFEVQAYVP